MDELGCVNGNELNHIWDIEFPIWDNTTNPDVPTGAATKYNFILDTINFISNANGYFPSLSIPLHFQPYGELYKIGRPLENEGSIKITNSLNLYTKITVSKISGLICGPAEDIVYTKEFISVQPPSIYFLVADVAKEIVLTKQGGQSVILIPPKIIYFLNIVFLGLDGIPPADANTVCDVITYGVTPGEVVIPPPPPEPPPVQILIPDPSNVIDLSFGSIDTTSLTVEDAFQIYFDVPVEYLVETQNKLDAWIETGQTTTVVIGNMPFSNIYLISYTNDQIIEGMTRARFVAVARPDHTQPIPAIVFPPPPEPPPEPPAPPFIPTSPLPPYLIYDDPIVTSIPGEWIHNYGSWYPNFKMYTVGTDGLTDVADNFNWLMENYGEYYAFNFIYAIWKVGGEQFSEQFLYDGYSRAELNRVVSTYANAQNFAPVGSSLTGALANYSLGQLYLFDQKRGADWEDAVLNRTLINLPKAVLAYDIDNYTKFLFGPVSERYNQLPPSEEDKLAFNHYYANRGYTAWPVTIGNFHRYLEMDPMNFDEVIHMSQSIPEGGLCIIPLTFPEEFPTKRADLVISDTSEGSLRWKQAWVSKIKGDRTNFTYPFFAEGNDIAFTFYGGPNSGNYIGVSPTDVWYVMVMFQTTSGEEVASTCPGGGCQFKAYLSLLS